MNLLSNLLKRIREARELARDTAPEAESEPVATEPAPPLEEVPETTEPQSA